MARLTGSHARVLEYWPDVGPPIAANLTCKSRLQVGQPNVITPSDGVDHDRMRALVVGTVDDEPGRDGFSHFFAGFLSALHAPNSAKNRPQLELASDSQWHRAWCVSSGSLVRRAALPSDSQFDWH